VTNIYFKLKDELVTPPLAGTILPGITRDSIITLAKDMGLNVQERQIPIDEVVSCIETGDMEEVFCTGAAAVVSPVSTLNYKGWDYCVGNGKDYRLSQKLYNLLIGIQYGNLDDPYGWRVKII
jgi:branched-chain amino acid aminotransferase